MQKIPKVHFCSKILYDNRVIQDEILGSNISIVIYFPQASFNIEQRGHGLRSNNPIQEIQPQSMESFTKLFQMSYLRSPKSFNLLQ